MNSIISLINFLLLYSLNRNHYDKVIFLLVLRMLYIDNYKKQLYISTYNSSPFKSPNLSYHNTLKKSNIEQSNVPKGTTDGNDFTFHNNSNSLSIDTIKNTSYHKNIDSIDYSYIDDYKINKVNDIKSESNTSDDVNYVDLNYTTTNNPDLKVNNKISDDSSTDMTYDLDSLLQFLILYSRNIPNYDNVLTVLFILNYYIRFILYPSISNQINIDYTSKLEKNTYSNKSSNNIQTLNDIPTKSTDFNENLKHTDEDTSCESNINEYSTNNTVSDSDSKTRSNHTNGTSILESDEISKINVLNESIQNSTNTKSAPINKLSIHKEKYSYDVTSTVKQIPLPNKIIVLTSDFNRTTPINTSDSNSELKKKVSVLLASCKINDLFKGELIFFNHIVDVANITNMVFINEATLIVDIRNNHYVGTLFLDGYIKTIFDSLIPISHSSNIVSSSYRNNIIFTPFSISENITLPFNSFEKPTVYNNLEIDITKISSNSDRILKNSKKINDYIYFYNKCELILEIDYIINLYKSEDILI